MIVQATLGGLGDHLLGHRAQRLGLGLRGDDALGRHQRRHEVGQHQSLVLGRAAKPLAFGWRALHPSSRELRDRPRSSSFTRTSSRDFCPKLVMASRSSGVFDSSSPTVLT